MKNEFYLSCPSFGRYEVIMKITTGDVIVATIAVLNFADYNSASKTRDALQFSQAEAIF